MEKGFSHVKCFDPTLCYTDSRGKKHFRHYSLANNLFLQMAQQVFDCGKCLRCRKAKANELAARCVLHASMYDSNCFLTLTYDEKKEGYHNNFNYEDVQKFKKRLRRWVQYHFNKRIEIFNVHEYGKNGKKHYHLIVFNFDFLDKEIFTKKNGLPLYTSKILEKRWSHGFCTIGDVSEASAMYQAKYMEKDFQHGNVTNSKKSHSQHSGIGRPYFLKHFRQILSLGFIPFNGKQIPVPRYFEKLAHKRWCHYNDPSAFVDLPSRDALYTPFKTGPLPYSQLEMSNLYEQYKTNKDAKTQELAQEWKNVIQEHLKTKIPPDFRKAGSNVLYDLKNRNNQEKF
ncbi:replication initiator protein [Apis mellifera associated microvirus 33]|nr:replication initiator protein [Apis mellifera associated microvirus 33]